MQARVLSRLRELCAQYGARLQPIDLGWGVSEEASLDQQAMNNCCSAAPYGTDTPYCLTEESYRRGIVDSRKNLTDDGRVPQGLQVHVDAVP